MRHLEVKEDVEELKDLIQIFERLISKDKNWEVIKEGVEGGVVNNRDAA